MELYWYIVVIIFIIIKIFFYVCWYRSRQRQLAAYLSNPRNAQIVIVGGRAYLHQVCERQSQTSIWPSWYGVQDEVSMEEASAAQPPAPAFSQLDMPPPYEAVSGEDDLKPPSYSECARGDGGPPPSFRPLAEGVDAVSINEAPPPYTPSAGAAAASSSSSAVPANRQEAPARQ